MPQTKPVELTDVQFYALQMLTEQRGVNLIQLADVIGDMTPQGLEFMRRLGDPSHEALTTFLSTARPETFKFLAEARDFEIEKLRDGLRMVVAFQMVGRAVRNGTVLLFGTFVGMALIWDKVAAWLKSR